MPKRNGTGIELLADPTRRRIIGLLALRERQPSKIATEIGLSRPATTRQLRLLERAGLVERRRSYLDGRSFTYYIDFRRLGPITAWLAGTEVGRQFPTAPPYGLPRPSLYPAPSSTQTPDSTDSSA